MENKYEKHDLQGLYEKAISTRYIDNAKPSQIKNDKITNEGILKPFYGLTCVAMVSENSEIYGRLIEERQKLENELKLAGMQDCFASVPDSSLHMTICDIDPSAIYDCQYSGVNNEQLAVRFGQILDAFEELGVPGAISCRVVGLGITTAITAIVRFSDTRQLEKVYNAEKTIKNKIGVSVRTFQGHITYGYVCKQPEDWERFIRILKKFENVVLGEAVFDRIDFMYFDSMVRYISLASKDLITGAITVNTKYVERALERINIPVVDPDISL